MEWIDQTAFLSNGPDLDAMGTQELMDYLSTVRDWIARLDEEEPEDMESEEYDRWGERHEALEDLSDDILDRLEEA